MRFCKGKRVIFGVVVEVDLCNGEATRRNACAAATMTVALDLRCQKAVNHGLSPLAALVRGQEGFKLY